MDPFEAFDTDGGDDTILSGAKALKSMKSRTEQSRIQKIQQAAERNEVGVINVDQDILDERKHFGSDYVDAIQTLFPNSTGLKPFGPVQKDSIRQSENVILNGGKVIKVEPRGYTKTSRTTNEATLATLYGHLQYTLILASSVTKANEILDAIKTELVENEHIERLFPRQVACFRHLEEKPQRARYQTYNGKHTHLKYSQDTIQMPVIEGEPSSGSVIQVRPKDNVRGIFKVVKGGPNAGKRIRPQLAFMDDIQTREEAANPKSVENIVDTIKRDVIMAGGVDRRLSCIMCATPIEPDDVTAKFMEERAWTAVVYKMLTKKPIHEEMWLTDYARILHDFDKRDPTSKNRATANALQFFKDNYDEMLEGAEWSWDWCYGWGEDPPTEIHPVQRFYNVFLDEGEKVATTELQCEVIITEDEKEDIRCPISTILTKTITREKNEFLTDCTNIVTHIDIHNDIFYWMTMASPDVFEGEILDWGTYPDQGIPYFKKASIKDKLGRHYEGPPDEVIFRALLDFFNYLHKKEYIRDDQTVHRNRLIGADAKYQPDAVYRAVRLNNIPQNTIATQGLSIKAKDVPLSERKAKTGEQKRFHSFITQAGDSTSKVLRMDVNQGKYEVHSALFVPTYSQGSIYFNLPSKRPVVHPVKIVAEHCNAEPCEKDKHEKPQREKWIFLDEGFDNHYFDTMVGCLYLLLSLGVELPRQYKRTKKLTQDVNNMMNPQGTQQGLPPGHVDVNKLMNPGG